MTFKAVGVVLSSSAEFWQLYQWILHWQGQSQIEVP